MTANVGSFDRILRFVIGVALIALPFVTVYSLWDSPVMTYGAIAAGSVLVLTALISICPLYSLFGVRTCRTG